MKIVTELLANTMSDDIWGMMRNYDFQEVAAGINAEMADIIEEIYEVLCSDTLSDFEAVEQIVSIYENHRLSSGVIHDFG